MTMSMKKSLAGFSSISILLANWAPPNLAQRSISTIHVFDLLGAHLGAALPIHPGLGLDCTDLHEFGEQTGAQRLCKTFETSHKLFSQASALSFSAVPP